MNPKPLRLLGHALDRRHFLRAAGATLALPWLEATQAPGGTPLPAPRRCLFLYVPNGVHSRDWQITSRGDAFEPSATLRMLAPFRSETTVFSGLHHPAGIGLAHRCESIWLTGADIGAEGAERPNSISADQLLADAIGSRTRFPSLELAVAGDGLAWTRDGVRLPAEREPRAVFERLFGLESEGLDARRARLRRRASVLDALLEETKQLVGDLGRDDRSKLDAYQSAVRELELRTQRAEGWLETPKPLVDEPTRDHFESTGLGSTPTARYRALMDLVVMALRTDSTRVVTCMLGSESHTPALPERDLPQTRHELSHHNGRPEVLERLARSDRFLLEQLVYLLTQLSSQEEGAESLLDRTMVLFGSGMSYGHGHGNANLPLILAGGRALGLRHGRHLDFNLARTGRYDLEDMNSYYRLCSQPIDPAARLGNLLLTMLQRMELPIERFADSTGPIAELLA